MNSSMEQKKVWVNKGYQVGQSNKSSPSVHKLLLVNGRWKVLVGKVEGESFMGCYVCVCVCAILQILNIKYFACLCILCQPVSI